MVTEFVRAPWATPAGVSSLLTVAPTAEPLTLEEGKLRAGLDWPAGDPRDGLMRAFIAAGRAKVEQDTGLALLEQTRRVVIDVPAGELIPLPAQTIPTVSITPEGESVPPVILGGAIVGGYTGSFLVVAGWPTPAALAAEAPLLLHAVGLLVAHLATLGRDLATIEEPFMVPYGYDEAIAPYRLMRIP